MSRRVIWLTSVALLIGTATILAVPTVAAAADEVAADSAQDKDPTRGIGGSLYWLPENIGDEHAVTIDSLFLVIFVVTVVVGIAVIATLLVFCFKYRAQDGAKASYTHGNGKLELLWTITPGIALLALALVQMDAWDKIKVNQPVWDATKSATEQKAIRVEVQARQFEFNFRYPGADDLFGTADDVLTKELRVPHEYTVLLQLRSRDVLHSLFIPNARFKQDLVPGITIPAWFRVHGPGGEVRKGVVDDGGIAVKGWAYDIACAELCGAQHFEMKTKLRIMAVDDYHAWYGARSAAVAANPGAQPENAVSVVTQKELDDQRQLVADAVKDNDAGEIEFETEQLALVESARATYVSERNWGWPWTQSTTAAISR